VARFLELRRHTANDGDALTDEGVRAALELGRELRGPYALFVSSGAQRATQTLACFACVLTAPVIDGVIVEEGLRSSVEDRLFAAYRAAGSGELSALREADPALVREDSERLAGGLRRIFDRLPDRTRALAAGHSPTNEAAVLGLTGEIIAPMPKGSGVLVVLDGSRASVEPLP
jgi:broad specificity phosphatase PhoE